MTYPFHCISRRLLICLNLVFWSFIENSWMSESSQVSFVDGIEEGFKSFDMPLKRPSRSILSLPPKHNTTLVATQDGTMYLVEIGSMRVIWSFPTGSPIYQSYQAPVSEDNIEENVSGLASEFMECGDDWALYIQSKHFGKMRVPTSIADFVAATPTFSDDGVVTLGLKKGTLFEVDAITGQVLRRYAADNGSALWSNDMMPSISSIKSAKNKVSTDPEKQNTPDLLLKIIRTDYSLQGSMTGKVLWTMTVAEFEASLYCGQIGSPSAGFEASEMGLDFVMPYTCHDVNKVYRLQNNSLLQGAISKRSSGDYLDKEIMLPLQSNLDLLLNRHDDIMTSPTSDPNLLNLGSFDNNDIATILSEPPAEITRQGDVDQNRMIKWLAALSIIMFTLFLLGFLMYCCISVVVKEQLTLKFKRSGSEIKIAALEETGPHKLGKKNGSIDDDDVTTTSRSHREARCNINKVGEGIEGREIGKLFVSNREIAKGSNGTIVLEGIYEGREVAVKRLVQAHHDVAFQEIKNLIASDSHPNIVRWHGVEYDRDFVYLALERCTCSLDDLIQIYSDLSINTMIRKDEASRCLMKAQIETGNDSMQNLWKADGYPSPLLLKLMRDVVSGLVHLHELGIVHRDLKPQNVLIINERSLSAKLSDMGISKHLLGDMSSFGHNATGCGSSGWQAPEQLLQGRQTRAVDLFSLGCVLFYCVTKGRHPFGGYLERDANIVKNQKVLSSVEFIPEAEDLISHLLNPNPDLRPKAIEVLHHPLFWSSEMKLSFLRDASDKVELEDRVTNSNVLKSLESIAPITIGANWGEKMDRDFKANIGYYRRYKFDSVRDLLRVMRNKLNHYRELPQQIQELIGPVPEGFNDYFASRFPRLLIEVYKIICKYCKEEECFQRYFKHVNN